MDSFPGRRSRAEWSGLAILTALAGVLRFWGLARQSIWVDETFSITYAGIFDGLSLEKLLINLQGPFHALLLFGWSRCFGPGVAALRSLEALAGTATVPALYWALRPSTRPAPRWLAVGLMAISPFDLWYSQEIRGYIFLILLAVISMGLLLRLAPGAAGDGSPTAAEAQRSSRHRWAWYTLVNALGLLSNLSYSFLLAAQAAWVIASRPARRRLLRGALISWAVTCVLLSPWLVQFWHRRVEPSGALSLRAIPTEEKMRGETTSPALGIPYTFYALSLGFSFGPSLRELHQIPTVGLSGLMRSYALPLLWAGLVFAALAILGALRLWRAGGPGRAWLTLAILPVLLTWGTAARNLKVLNPRYASAALPGYLLVLAEGITRPRGRMAPGLLAAALLLPVGVSVAQYQTVPRYWKDDARGLRDFLARECTRDDAIFIYGTDLPLRVYYWQTGPGRPPAEVADAWNWVTDPWEDQVRRFEELRRAHARVFILELRPQEVDPAGRWRDYFDRHLPQAQKVEFLGATVWVASGREGT